VRQAIVAIEDPFQEAGRMSREGIERVCPASEVRKFCAGTQNLMGQALAYPATSRVVCALRQAHLQHESYRP